MFTPGLVAAKPHTLSLSVEAFQDLSGSIEQMGLTHFYQWRVVDKLGAELAFGFSEDRFTAVEDSQKAMRFLAQFPEERRAWRERSFKARLLARKYVRDSIPNRPLPIP